MVLGYCTAGQPQSCKLSMDTVLCIGRSKAKQSRHSLLVGSTGSVAVLPQSLQLLQQSIWAVGILDSRISTALKLTQWHTIRCCSNLRKTSAAGHTADGFERFGPQNWHEDLHGTALGRLENAEVYHITN